MKGSLTVWALYAYFSDSQKAAFLASDVVHVVSVQKVNLMARASEQNISKFMRTREIWRVERGGGLKINDNEK